MAIDDSVMADLDGTDRHSGEQIDTALILNNLADPVLVIASDSAIKYTNLAAEQFFGVSATVMYRYKLEDMIPFGSPLLSLVDQVREQGGTVVEYGLDLGGGDNRSKLVDLQVSRLGDNRDRILLALSEHTVAAKFDRQLNHRGAVRSMSGMAAVLAHEVRNPLSGIRGAAQLLEQNASDDDKGLAQLIQEETDRISGLIERMELFGDTPPLDRGAVNIHDVLEHVRKVAENGFGSHVRYEESYDPSLPPVPGNRDQLIQVFLNLVKNAVEAAAEDDPVVKLTTAYRPGIRLSVGGSADRMQLPLEVCVFDNGPGVADEINRHLFEPFVTTKAKGTGLGLALVAKIIGDHGGVIEYDRSGGETVFRTLLPLQRQKPDNNRDVD